MKAVVRLRHERITSLTWAPEEPPAPARFLETMRVQRKAPGTIENYVCVLLDVETFLGGPLVDATADHLDSYMAHLHGRGLSSATIAKRQQMLRVFFRWAMEIEPPLVAKNPTRRFKAPRPDVLEARHLSEAQVSKLVQALRSETPWDRALSAMVLCMLYAGLRRGEVAGLEIERIRLDEGRMVVYGKGRRERTLPLAGPLAAALRAVLADHPTGAGRLFVCGPDARPVTGGQVSGRVKALLKSIGLGKYRVHDLRHTFATRLVRRGVPVQDLQILLGHQHIDTTMRYTHAELRLDTLAAIDAL